MASELPPVGFIGVGAMGGPMARNLLRAGYAVRAYDTQPERVAACGAAGAAAPDEVVAQTEIVCLSLPSSDAFVRVAEETLLLNARPGQVFIDFGTTTPPETRRVAGALAAAGVDLLDAPVSGGEAGAQKAELRMFVGGDAATFERCLPLLAAVAGRDGITYCGPSGAGQVVKGVNQLAMGLGAAAYLEAVAFGVRARVDPAVLRAAVGGTGGTGHWREHLDTVAARVAQGHGDQLGVKFRELPYFLREAREQGFSLPLTETLYTVCDAGERVVVDDNRPAPSFWHELMKDPKAR